MQLALEGVVQRAADRVRQMDVGGGDEQCVSILAHLHQTLQRMIRLLAFFDVANSCEDLVAVRARELARDAHFARGIAVADPLASGAQHTVFADGVAGAPVMVVGEAPGADEDRLGKPFVGVSGQLMDRMFDAIGMSRERDLYITNILFWRPPGNRTPTLAEQAICLAFTRRHIELARPKVLVLAGGTAAKAVLDTTEGIMRMRGKWTSVRLDDGSEVPTLPTFHPAYLLRTPASKRQSWLDLLALDKKLKELGVR